jgi:hypothetical protein
MYIGLHAKYPLFLLDFNETWISATYFRKKNSNIRFHKNTSSGSRVVPCGQTYMKMLTVALRHFANVPKNVKNILVLTIIIQLGMSLQDLNFLILTIAFYYRTNIWGGRKSSCVKREVQRCALWQTRKSSMQFLFVQFKKKMIEW